MSLRIGIDIGSTTVKVVVLDEQNKLLFRSYERHYSKTRERTCQTLQGLRGMLGGQEIKLDEQEYMVCKLSDILAVVE